MFYADMTDNESAEMENAIEDWSTSDLRNIMLMIAITIVILHNFIFSIDGIQFVEGNIIIVPAIIGLNLQCNLHFKKSLLKLATATTSIVKRMALNNVTTTNCIIQRTMMNIISSTVKATYLTSVAAIMFVVKKPTISHLIFYVLISMHSILLFNLSYISRTIEAACLLLMILTASFNHVKFPTRQMHLVIPIIASSFIVAIGYYILVLLIAVRLNYYDPIVIVLVSFYILVFCLFFFCYPNSHATVYIALTLSIIIFTHDLVPSLVEIPDVNLLLHLFLLQALIFYFGACNYGFCTPFCICCYN